MTTIFAPATANIKSGVAIIRISGVKAPEALKKLTKTGLPAQREAKFCKFYSPETGELIDTGLALWFEAPHSFTGEDVVELHVHGSIAVVNEIMDCLSGIEGLQIAEPGEFSRRAFENGKMDLAEAEGLADLIDAQTKQQAKQALRQQQGHLSKLYEKWREDLISVMANLEAYIDFPDEEIPEEVVNDIEKQIYDFEQSLKNHLNDNNKGERLRDGLCAVVLGEPNVGKSSIINMLARRDVAIVSDVAGTTRDLIEVHLDISGYPVIVTDTAGLREKAQKIEQEGIKRALARADSADLKIIVISADNVKNLDDKALKLIDAGTILVINKTDLVKAENLPDDVQGFKPVMVSVKEKKGLDDLVGQISNYTEKYFQNISGPIITRQRHRSLLQEVLGNVERFSLNKEFELAAEDLRKAAFCLGRITGRIDVEDILDKIFSSFCIGK